MCLRFLSGILKCLRKETEPCFQHGQTGGLSPAQRVWGTISRVVPVEATLLRVCPIALNPHLLYQIVRFGRIKWQDVRQQWQAVRDFSVYFIQCQWSNLASANILINCEVWLMYFSSVTLSGYGFISDSVTGTGYGVFLSHKLLRAVI